MKKSILFLLLFILSIAPSQAQNTNDPIELTNSLSGLWECGSTQKAVENSIALYQLRPPFFIDRIHNSLAQKVEDKYTPEYALDYLTALRQQGNQEINDITLPIYLWSKAVNAKETSEYKNIVTELNQIMGNKSNYTSKAERYILLTTKELKDNNAISKEEAERIVKKVIEALETYPYRIIKTEDKQESYKRAWHRFMLAYCYDYLYSNFDADAKYLKLSSDYSPDLNDKQSRHNYFYDAAVLGLDPRNLDFKSKYEAYLKTNKKDNELLDLYATIALENPNQKNINVLNSHFCKMNPNASFNAFWAKYINSQGTPSPKLKLDFGIEVLDLTIAPGTWIYIDVWATWCKPCRNELPEFQKFYSENLANKDSNLKVYTFSYNSQKLDEFMTEQEYSFPVCEINKETNDAFYIKSYPTKILITPEGNYIKIPYSADWKMYLRGYVQL